MKRESKTYALVAGSGYNDHPSFHGSADSVVDNESFQTNYG